ncbi:branched-chain-amino-acid aminotransferase: cytosolic-like protein [Leptotrombidium deliense]|uniref:Branched-chain-amino-acid aminotransferase: cytosolic-like protein n=1 Tax=Leptotrombidium deliense TaxID=299467 RepID=A0A443SCG9_9ACAR|nr:branched-chain-amino-acid aminotransferase: cytosolic-like protein [Leptotrombidium deliense]
MHRKAQDEGSKQRPEKPMFDDEQTPVVPIVPTAPKSPPIPTTGIKQFRCSGGFAGSFAPNFGKPCCDFTSNMLEAKWSREFGWDPMYMVPFQNLSLSPGSRVILQGQQVYDVIQATMGFDNRIRLFRPDQHLQRLRRTAAKLSLPDFDEHELLICVKRLVLSDASFIPPAYTNGSLEVRIMFIGPEPNNKITMSREATLYAFMIRHSSQSVAEYKRSKIVYADPKYSRAWIGSLAQYKTSANIAPTFYVTDIANGLGCNDVLWLYGKEEHVLDFNEANVFIFIINDRNKKELITPPLNGLIVPGITRQSILEMVRYWNEFTVSERSISIHELRTLQRQRRLLEIIATNVMGNAIPVIRIHYESTRTDIHIPSLEHREPLWERLNRALHSIEFGLVDHPWGLII